MAKIYINCQPMNQPSGHDISLCIPLSENLITNAFQKIDFPDHDADPLTRELICTSTTKINEVLMERDKAAEMLSEIITHALLEAMGMNDTIMGYKKTRG